MSMCIGVCLYACVCLCQYVNAPVCWRHFHLLVLGWGALRLEEEVLCDGRMPLKVLCSPDAHSGRTDGLSWFIDKPLATWVFHMLRVGSTSRPGSPDWRSPGFSGRDEL